MGNWKLEVFKMTIYMSFPVGLFHYFNQPEYFEDWVIRTKRELFPKENTIEQLALKDAIKSIQKENELKRLEMLENKS